MAKQFHIVCEGQTDIEIFKRIIKKVGQVQKDTYTTQIMFPPKSQQIGGWSTLRNWCLAQASALAGNTQRALGAAQALGATPTNFAASKSKDKIAAALSLITNPAATNNKFIIIHLDTDIAHHISAQFNFAPAPPVTIADRISICDQALDSWLGGHLAKKGTKIFYCLTSLAIENWILTLHPHANIVHATGINVPTQYDDILNPDQCLVSLGYKSEKNGQLRKKPKLYESYGADIANNLQTSRNRSRILDNFCTTIISA